VKWVRKTPCNSLSQTGCGSVRHIDPPDSVTDGNGEDPWKIKG